MPTCTCCKAVNCRGSSRKNRDPNRPQLRAPVRAQKTRKPRASTATLARTLDGVHASFRRLAQPRPAGTARCRVRGRWRPSRPWNRTPARASGSPRAAPSSSPMASCWRSCSGPGPAAPARSTSPPPCCAGSAARRACSRATPRRARGVCGHRARVRATLVLAALELGRRAAAGRPIRGQRLAGASEVWTYFRGRLAPLAVEEFWAIGLDVRHRVQSETLPRARIADRRRDPPARRVPSADPPGDRRRDLLSQPPVRRSRAVARGRRADGAPARRRRSVRHSRARSRRRRAGRATSAWPSAIGDER